MLKTWQNQDEFTHRHIGPNALETQEMLAALKVTSMAGLLEKIIPEGILTHSELPLPEGLTEHQALEVLKKMMSQNALKQNMIGQGYYETLTPSVILRNVFQNPGWYTAYTPYQAEISQGRLEVLLSFQQLIMDLTGFDLANAALLDEATAAAEAMSMAKRITGCARKAFFIDINLFPQTIAVMKTRAQYLGFELIIDDAEKAPFYDVFGAIFQYPDKNGAIQDFTDLFKKLADRKVVKILASDLLALVLLKSPCEMGADIALGSSQRFGVPIGFGGPHAAFFASRSEYKRNMPGRIIGVSRDAREKIALRMALQTREQHIRREKANSNICTSQVLLANMAVLYAMYHGKNGLSNIAHRVHYFANLLQRALIAAGLEVLGEDIFDTVTIYNFPCEQDSHPDYNFYHESNRVSLSFSELSTPEDVVALYNIFTGKETAFPVLQRVYTEAMHLARYATWYRQDVILEHENFRRYHTETQMLRYLKKLENRDLSLTQSMIPLGSCTMKLNAATELIPLSWPKIANIHPFAPVSQTLGYQMMLEMLSDQLKALTGFAAISLQPNSGAQGEYAGLLAIRRYQAAQGEAHRNICLIPRSAHGTNPATAQMMGLEVVVVDCDAQGNVSVADLRTRAQQYQKQLCCLMITYPSTHGVFEVAIKEITQIVHSSGGQVYMDGANFNALVAYVKPAELGADVMHMNLHKTFAIPHGGGGPGMGPIGVAAHLAGFLPAKEIGAVSASLYGSASILIISLLYIAMMGKNGLKRATEYALLNANYVAEKLKNYYPVLYTGENGFVAHECILDIRTIKAKTGISELDIAKRLIDYGFHAPTMSFPVPGTLMVEPTESEDKAELDRFIDAMIAIFHETEKVALGEWDALDNPLKHAPHTQADVREWNKPYSIEIGCYPSAYTKAQKYWPAVNRVDDAFGDRNLLCACPPLSSYED